MEMRELLQAGRYPEALDLLSDVEEMGKHGLLGNIDSFVQRLLLHLIKQHAERRTTASWDVSIKNSIYEIEKLNRRPKGRGFYVSADELREVVEAAYPNALGKASLEALKGEYEDTQLEKFIDPVAVRAEALAVLLAHLSK